eukprot:3940907-Rhodomonas_salina.2
MSGTSIAYRAASLRARYAMPGTDIAYGATRPSGCTGPLLLVRAYPPTRALGPPLRALSAVSGTDLAYAAKTTTRSPVLTWRMLLPRARRFSSGTDLAYAARRSP